MRRNYLDYVRLLAAILVFLGHARNFNVVESVPWAHFISEQSVYVFFSISGYLIFRSAQANSPSVYVLRRVSRIMPALIINLLCISFILSPLTALLVNQTWYFSDAFIFFLKNCVLIPAWQTSIGNTLYGVGFNQTWNSPLWTLFFEVFCYAFVISLVIVFRKYRQVALILFCVAVSTYVALTSTLPSTTLLTVLRLLVFFLMGAMFNFSQRKFTWVILATIGFGEMFGLGSVLILNSLLICLLLFVVFPSGEKFSKSKLPGDYSYGIYIWHWPILQTVFAVEGAIGSNPSWLVSFIIAFPLVAMIAMISWHLLERPCLLLFNRS